MSLPPSRRPGGGRTPLFSLSASLLLAATLDLAHAQAPPTGEAPLNALDASSAPTGPPLVGFAPQPGGTQLSHILPHDLSPWGMFLHADNIVKAVMLGLAFASLVTWTIWIAKGTALTGATWRARTAVRALAKADVIDCEADRAWHRSRVVGAMVEAVQEEVNRSDGLPAEGIKERVGLVLGRIEARASRSMARGTGVIATIGSTAPFVGLFGTVWGIMDSFVGISQAHTSNLAVVAPGIAEALLATAIGLVAAIPAVVIYNGFARATAGYRALLADASAEVLRHLSRDLDRRGAKAGPARRAAE